MRVLLVRTYAECEYFAQPLYFFIDRMFSFRQTRAETLFMLFS